jgi:DNA repair exonuclease SbcCD ATPase subunit
MLLLSLTVRNYRVHRDLTVEFDPERNLIGGPNETGKSTLAEAIHRALFMRFKAGGDLQKSMVSDTHGGHPEVKLTFEAAGDTWTIEKLFAGSTRGTARLSSRSGISLQGDAAEEKLSELTGNTAGMANRENDLATRWAHLWVWQGTAGADASAHAIAHRNELIQRLQENGLAAVMQSETDEKTREKIRIIHESLFTKTGTIKTGSRLDIATKALADATAKLNAATDQKARLESAIAGQETATREIAASEAALPGLREQLTTAGASLAKARELGARLENQKLLHSQAAAALNDLTKSDQQIRSILAQAAAAREALVPYEQQLAALTEQATAASAKAAEAKTAVDAIGNTLRLARQHHDLANACVTRFEKAAVHEALTTKARDIAEIERSLTTDRDTLSRLPAVSQTQLDTLRDLEAQQAQAQSALEAIATGIELISSPQAVLLDNEALVPGSPRVITETSELSLADGTRLRILPGGGNSLAASRQKVSELGKQLAILLDQLAIADSRQAAEILTRRQALEQKISSTQSRLKDLGARDLPDSLATAATALAAAIAEVERRHAAFSSEQTPTLPGSLAAAQAWQTETREALQSADQSEQSLRAAAEATNQTHQEKLSARQSAQETLVAKRLQITDFETSARILEQNHGDSATRTQAIATASASEAAAKITLDATTASLADLNPDRLAQEVARLERVSTNEQTKQQDARMRLAVAQNTLATDGTSDPEADLLQARARHATASDEHAREKRHADAIALLNRLFSESRESIGRSVTQPIADRVAGYLECLYGRGVRIDVDWNEPGQKSTIHITRPGAPTFAFETLSGGAKEQVAAAVRLATAEILAASHNGCLPILFDDSFAYSDDDRTRSLQSMLDLAATRGLQVLVLTCTPAAYIGFGARETRLVAAMERSDIAGLAENLSSPANFIRHANPTMPIDPMAEDTRIDNLPAPSTPLPENAESLFLETLRSLGKSSGNQTLRTALGWDESSYNQVKASLIARNLITTGKGRGGSVSIAEPA